MRSVPLDILTWRTSKQQILVMMLLHIMSECLKWRALELEKWDLTKMNPNPLLDQRRKISEILAHVLRGRWFNCTYWAYSQIKVGEGGIPPIIHVKQVKRCALARKNYLSWSVNHFCGFYHQSHKLSLNVLTVLTYVTTISAYEPQTQKSRPSDSFRAVFDDNCWLCYM